jgi:hypothetical protein
MTRPKAKTGFYGSGLTKEEISKGSLRYNEYLKNYPQLNKLSNLQLLDDLVWLECIQERFKEQVGVIITQDPIPGPDGKKKHPESVPKLLQESIANGLEQIIGLKTKLGLFEDQKTIDAFKDFEILKEKAAEYRATHPLEFQTTCCHCGKIYFLKRRTVGFESHKSPFFAEDKILRNDYLHKLQKDGKITKEDEAMVLGTSPDYPDWLDKYVYGHKPKVN